MNLLQGQRLFSILTALLVGAWLPLELIGYDLPYLANLACDLLVSLASINNIALHFRERATDPRKLPSWQHASLLLDLLCVLPLAWIGSLAYGSGPNPLLLVNLLTARHIWKIKAFLDGFTNLKPVYYRLIPIAFTMPLLVHLVACSWIALGSGTAGPDANHTLEYIKAVYWSFTTLTTVGYGDISAKTPAQMLFAAMVQVAGVGVFGFILSNVASLLSRLDAAREHHMDSLDRIETFMDSHKVKGELRSKVRAYFHFLWTQHKGYSDRTLLDGLPRKVQSDLFLFINRSIITKVPMFKNASPELLEQLMSALEPKIYVPSETIFLAGDPGSAMYLVHHGSVRIEARDGKPLATLGEGAFFGETALLTDQTRNATARAESYCDIYVLSREDFTRAIAAHPDFKLQLENVSAARIAS